MDLGIILVGFYVIAGITLLSVTIAMIVAFFSISKHVFDIASTNRMILNKLNEIHKSGSLTRET